MGSKFEKANNSITANAGGSGANKIVQWLRTGQFIPLGAGVDGGVLAIDSSRGRAYASGDFHTAGLVGADYIARWDGGAWSPLGSGTNDTVLAVAVNGNDVFAGGYFTSAV